MYTKTVTITNQSGLHARPASEFVKAAAGFAADITIARVSATAGPGTASANAKSIVLLLSLGLSQGTQVQITATGPDEREAVDTLVALIEGKFGEQ